MTTNGPATEQIFAQPDVIAVLNRLTDMVSNARSMPMTASVLINQAEALELLNNATSALPDDVVTADKIIARATEVVNQADAEAEAVRSEADGYSQAVRAETDQFCEDTRARAQEEAQRIVAQAQSEAEEIVNQAHREANNEITAAREHAEHLINQETVLIEAQQRADEVLADADMKAQQMANNADAYVDGALADLEGLLTDILNQAQNGRRRLARAAEGQ